ncbi:MAG: SIMPL domain-containing protein [Candidatus Eremiobacteraeota bacterium]|nr:SIMPL domain-containing protein [Candidatus Eremiobacteraeota bacterium]
MKYLGISLMAILLLGSAPSKTVTITVNGEGTVSRNPDTAMLGINLQTTNDIAQAATTENNGRYNDLRNRLHEIGVDDASIRTLSYNVNYQPSPPQMEPGALQTQQYPVRYQPRYGYTVSRSLQIKMTNLDLVGKVVDAAVAANVSNVYNVGYSVSNYRELYAQALKAAVADAQRQANAMASAANMHVVRIAAMQMQGYGYYPPPMPMRAMPMPMSAQTGIPTEIQAPNPVDVHAGVTVTYVISP